MSTKRRRILEEVNKFFDSTTSEEFLSTPNVSSSSAILSNETDIDNVETFTGIVGEFTETANVPSLSYNNQPEQQILNNTTAVHNCDNFSSQRDPNDLSNHATLENNEDVNHFIDDEHSEVEMNEIEKCKYATAELKRLKIRHNWSQKCLQEVAVLINALGTEVPLDPRTICQTDLTPPERDDFFFLGLADSIASFLKSSQPSSYKLPNTLHLHLNVDGISLFNSSNKSLWPILGSIENIGNGRPFVIGCYFGVSKPPSAEGYLGQFVQEYLALRNAGLMHQGCLYNIELKAVICDAQARSFLKGITGQNGYGACERCVVKGVYVDDYHKVIYELFDAPLRTDESFRRRQDERHHKYWSPLLLIEHLDMIYDIPLDYMHLVCLGVMKRLLEIWTGKRPHCFSAAQKGLFNHRIKKFAKCFSKEFKRKGRGLNELAHWKASEFRTFILYSGPLILRNILNDEKYDHFLNLHCALRLLCSSNPSRLQILDAGKLLKFFSYKFAVLYGNEHLVYCVHTLIHLAHDCLIHGSLNKFSCFKYESFLGRIKRLISGPYKPLSQLKRRLSELNSTGVSMLYDNGCDNFWRDPARQATNDSILHFVN